MGWQIYDLTNDPLDLGLVGLVQFFPLIAMAIVAGQLLDLFDRRAIAACARPARRWPRSRSRSAARAARSRATPCSRSCFFPAPRARSRSRPCTHCCRGWCRRRCCRAPLPPPPPRSRPPSSAGRRSAGSSMRSARPVVYAACTLMFIAAGVLTALCPILRSAASAGGQGAGNRVRRSRSRPCSPAFATSAKIRSCSAPSRSICSRCCSAA